MKSVAMLLCLFFALVCFASDIDQARALIKDNKLDEARVLLEKSVTDPGQKRESLVLLTSLFNAKNDFEKSVEFGKQAIMALPNSSEAHHQYSVALRLKMINGSKLKAMLLIGTYKDELKAALTLDPKNIDAREEELGFLLSAPSIAGGDLKKAKQRTEELRKYDADLATYYDVLILRREGNIEGAIALVRQYLEKKPERHETRLNLAMMLQEAKRFKEAEQELGKLLADTEGTWALAATYQMGRTRILGQYDQEKAVEGFLEYIAKVPEDAKGLPTKTAAYWRLGNAHEQLKQFDKARQAYQKALDLDPKNEEAKQALKKLPKG